MQSKKIRPTEGSAVGTSRFDSSSMEDIALDVMADPKRPHGILDLPGAAASTSRVTTTALAGGTTVQAPQDEWFGTAGVNAAAAGNAIITVDNIHKVLGPGERGGWDGRADARSLAQSYLMGAEAVPALRGVSLSVAAGEFVCLFGTSGGGKTTLVRSSRACVRMFSAHGERSSTSSAPSTSHRVAT